MRISLIGPPLAAVCLAALTAACSGHHPAEGTLTGHLYGVGGPTAGPAIPAPRPWPGTVTVTGPRVHRDVPVGASGTYSVTVPAGRYTITGHSPLFGSGTYPCQATGVATVTSGHTTTADVLCQMMLPTQHTNKPDDPADQPPARGPRRQLPHPRRSHQRTPPLGMQPRLPRSHSEWRLP